MEIAFLIVLAIFSIGIFTLIKWTIRGLNKIFDFKESSFDNIVALIGALIIFISILIS